MGPGREMPKERSFIDPPMFSPDGDLREWRRKIGRWVDLMKAASEQGSDRTYQTMYKILGRTLYERGLPSAQQSIVDEAQSKGTIDYTQTDSVAVVLEIVNLIAVDPPIAMVSRLINSFNKVTSCRRKKHEELSTFVSRFRGFAAEHLLHANASSSSQIGEVLAITLLNNANLEEGTLTNAKLQLISMAEARAKEDDNGEIFSLPLTRLTDVAVISEKLVKLDKDKSTNLTSNEYKKFLADFRSQSLGLIKQLEKTVHDIRRLAKEPVDDSVSGKFTSDQKSCRLHLDDAVLVLRNLSQTSNTTSSVGLSMKDVQSLVDRKVHQALLASSRDSSRKTGNTDSCSDSKTYSRNNPLPPPLKSEKAPKGILNRLGKRKVRFDTGDSFCYDCGSHDHKRGDENCQNPSFLTKKRRGLMDGNKTNRDNDEDEKKFFRKGSRAASK